MSILQIRYNFLFYFPNNHCSLKAPAYTLHIAISLQSRAEFGCTKYTYALNTKKNPGEWLSGQRGMPIQSKFPGNAFFEKLWRTLSGAFTQKILSNYRVSCGLDSGL